MPGAHVIETLSFEVGFATEEQARAQHNRLGDFAGGRGLQIIDEVFDEVLAELGASAAAVRLERLEVDLGETPDDWAQAEPRLRRALREALLMAIGPLGRAEAGPGAPPIAAAGEDAELEMVWSHLHHGLLPWSVDPSDGDAFAALVGRVLASRGDVLAARLRAAPGGGRLIVRLSRQWPAVALQALAERLAMVSGAGGDAASEASRVGASGADTGTAPTSADGWARRLSALAGLDPALTAAAVATSPVALTEAGWPALINGDPATVRSRLRAAAALPAARRRLGALLDEPGRLGQLLSLWGAGPDVAFVAAIAGAPQAWRLGLAARPAEIGGALREGLLEHLLGEDVERLDVEAAVARMVAARARLDGLAPARVAQALASGWPAEGPGAPQRPRLLAALAARFWLPPEEISHPGGATAAGPARGWRFDLGGPEAGAERASLSEAGPGSWADRFRREPSTLAELLRRQGRTVAGRRRLARTLTRARLDEVLALWTSPAEAAFLAGVLGTPEPWRLDAAHAAADVSLRLREWLLDDLLLARPGPARTARELLAGLVRRRATFDDLRPADAARRLAARWPTGGPPGRLRTQVLDALAAEGLIGEGGVESMGAPADALPTILPAETGARAILGEALARRDFAAATRAVTAALALDRGWLRAALPQLASAAELRTGLIAALPSARRFELAQLWQGEHEVRLLLTLPAASIRDDRVWDVVFAAAWAPDTGGREAGPGQSDAAAAEPQGAALAGARQRAPARLLRALHRAGLLTALAGETRQALRAARGYVRDAVDPQARPAAAAAEFLSAWRGRLPDRLSAASARAIAPLLTPAAAGMRQLAAWSEAERRSLVSALRPDEAPGLLAAADALTAAVRTAGLAEPPDGWADFRWRNVLRELFEEGWPLDAPGFAVRWFEAWTARAPALAAEDARRRLALALEAGAGAADAASALSTVDDVGQADAAGTMRSRSWKADGEGARSTVEGGQEASATDRETAAPAVAPARPGRVADPSQISLGPDQVAPDPDATEAVAERAGAPDTDGRASTSRPFQPAALAGGAGVGAPGATASEAVAEPGVPGRVSDGVPAGIAPTADAGSRARPPVVADTAALAAALRGDGAADDDPDVAAEPAPDGAIYVANAGLVLLAPYIPMLLSRLELTREGRFVDDGARERAVHLLQFVTDGAAEPSAEAALALNKLVCGMDFRTPVGRDFQVRAPEQALVESLLRTVIQRWSTLGRTSIDGLRETFLQRRGALRLDEALDEPAWRLTVERGPYDMLLDRIPWGYATLKLPWMPQVLHVDWR